MSIKKLGRYDVVRLLGKGAMGLVYEGRDPNLDRRVAIKTIRVENLSGEAAAEYEVRFRTEAHSAARLQHPNIVSVYDSDRDGDVAFLVMEFIEGDDLKYHLDKGDRYTLDHSLGIMADLLSALDYAHRRNIVHRDIKPANLLIEPNGRVKLTDFGVARIQDSGDATRTQGSIVGTLKHMSPEQVQGLPVDARADLFAAGIVLYQLLTGSRPFDAGTDFAIIEQVVRHIPPAPTTLNHKLPPAVDAVVAKALAKSRDHRFATAREFAAALSDACKDATEASLLAPATEPYSVNQAGWTGTLRAGEALTGAQSSTAPGMSTVTLEVELVYWKEIKDSEDIEDLQAFLVKFPSGVYAALARRRLRKLGVFAGGDSDTSTLTGTLLTPNLPGHMDKTVFVPRGAATKAGQPKQASDLNGEGHEENSDGSSSLAETPGSAQSTRTPLSAVMRHSEDASAAKRRKKSDPAANVQAIAADATMKLLAGSVQPIGQDRQSSTTPPRKPNASMSKSNQPRAWGWIVTVLFLLAGSGLGFKLFLGSDSPTVAAPVNEQSSQPGMMTAKPAVTPLPVAIEAALPTSEKAALPAIAASVSTSKAPDSVAVALAADRKLAAAEKKAQAKQAKQAKAAVASTEPEPKSSTTSSEVAAHAPSPLEPRAARADPRLACEDRLFLSFQICMASQCAKPTFASHPTCVERRSMEQKRREAEQNR
ncbi:MAG: protein kinase [Polaromonas sp.]|nr:protein kinase [Polaromonas sp.]